MKKKKKKKMTIMRLKSIMLIIKLKTHFTHCKVILKKIFLINNYLAVMLIFPLLDEVIKV